MNDFAVFILTHGRPDRVVTYSTLKKQGYTGKVYFIVDDEDQTLPEYKARFGDSVIAFNKLEISKTFDIEDNFKERRGVVYARNVSFEIARKLKIKYFLQLDDDYTSFVYKFTKTYGYKERRILNLDRLFSAFLKYYKSINALTLCMAQNGDFIGGKQNKNFAQRVRLHRKGMNTFFCSVERPFQFLGRINEDVNMYVYLGYLGKLILTVPNVAIIQRTTQKNAEGMTNLYLDFGTYVKSFYSVMLCPSFVRIMAMGDKHKRLHHSIAWDNAVPKIMDERYRLKK